MYNKVILAGNLARDIEIRYTQGGSAIGKTAIATSRKFKSQTGEMKEEVMFVDLTFFGRTAEIANQYLKKGSKVLVDGRLTQDQWTAQDGTKKSKHSITVENLQMLGNKDASTGGYGDNNSSPSNYAPPSQSQQQSAPKPQSQSNEPFPEINIENDEIPF